MAARENQGYLIAVILLVMLSIVLAITTYFGFTSASENSSQLSQKSEELDREKKSSQGYEALFRMLSSYMGNEGASIADVSTAQDQLNQTGLPDLISRGQKIADEYKLDMSKHATTPNAQDLTYRKLLNDIVATLGELHNTRAILDGQVRAANQNLRDQLAAKDQELAARQQQVDQARTDLATEKENHDKTRSELNQQLDAAQLSINTQGQTIDKLKSDLVTKEKSYEEELAKRVRRIDELSQQLADVTRTEVPLPDGMVVSVAPSLHKVTINLGYGDKLRPNQTFAIYDQSKTHFRSGEEKAKIEVTRIIDAHLAEARILAGRITNPILVRDYIVTPAWDPGYSAPIAIAGNIDLDGDEVSDLQRLISIVEQNGGRVVAWHDEEGEVNGKVDENTRLIVMGDTPLGRAREAYERLVQQKNTYQTREISVREFLNEIGYRSEATIQEFNQRQFIPRTPTAVEESAEAPASSGGGDQ